VKLYCNPLFNARAQYMVATALGRCFVEI